jgi:hypothetical protein
LLSGYTIRRSSQDRHLADAAGQLGEAMLEVRIKHRLYSVSNATLDRIMGAGSWRKMSPLGLQNTIKGHHAAGRLVIDGRRLRCASPSEEAAQRLQTSAGVDEILRSGLLLIAARITELVDDVRRLREQLELDAEAANAPLARAGREVSQLQDGDGNPSGEQLRRSSQGRG